MKYFKVSWLDSEIKEIEIEKETDKFCMYNGCRHAKRTKDFNNYFPTFEEAKQFKIDEMEEAIKRYKDNIESLEKSIIRKKADLEEALKETPNA